MTMTLLTTKEASINLKTPVQFVRKYIDDDYCLELLRFFGTYPFARFSELAIIHALNDDDKKFRIRNALERLVIDGAVTTCIEHGAHLYHLTDNESVRDPVVSLAKIDWHHWRMMLEH